MSVAYVTRTNFNLYYYLHKRWIWAKKWIFMDIYPHVTGDQSKAKEHSKPI